jgi:hypothetical protein
MDDRRGAWINDLQRGWLESGVNSASPGRCLKHAHYPKQHIASKRVSGKNSDCTNSPETAMFFDLQELQAKQYIDATQTRSAFLEAEQQAIKYRGSMFWRTVKQRDYLIKKIGAIEKSLGVRTSETESIFNQFRYKKTASEDRQRELSSSLIQQQRVNAALRVGRTPNVVIDLLEALRHAKIANHFMVIGTNAMYAYETHAGIRFSGNLTATTDVDFLWDSRKRLSLVSSDPEFNERGLIGILKKADPTFQIMKDKPYQASNNKGYMVDIIKHRPLSLFDDREESQLRPLANDFWAAKIMNMDWLLSSPKFTQTIVAINGKMAEMITIDPRAFVLFKLFISEKEDRDPIKKPRDFAQAVTVYNLIQERMPHYGFDRIHVFPNRIKAMLELTNSIQ